MYKTLLYKHNNKNLKIKTICVGNIYIGGTGKTSLCIKINEILNKKILVYGLGKSGLSTYNFLKKNNNVFLYDDFQKKTKKKKYSVKSGNKRGSRRGKLHNRKKLNKKSKGVWRLRKIHKS